MEMGFPRESHGKCPMEWDGMEQHTLHFHGTYGTEIDEQEIQILLNELRDS